MTQARIDCAKRSRQSIRLLHALGLAYHSRDIPRYSFGKELVGEIRDTFTFLQWLSGRVLDSRPRGRGFEPHWRHCVVSLEQDTFT